MIRRLIVFTVIWLTAAAFLGLPDQSIPSDNTVAMIRAHYLYQFANNNNWPNDTKKGKFYVGIMGDEDVFNIMAEKYGTKPIGSQTLDVVSCTEISASRYMHIIFIDKSKKHELAKCVKELKDKSTLIVTNWEGALTQGSHINFKNVDGTIRFELNKKGMEEKKITPGVKIIQWALQ
ncbi:MAG TPA: YfiR family protein [Flavobacteriales bacterium]|jgi:hypothetical protein